jgi:hypothetical protein
MNHMPMFRDEKQLNMQNVHADSSALPLFFQKRFTDFVPVLVLDACHLLKGAIQCYAVFIVE